MSQEYIVLHRQKRRQKTFVEQFMEWLETIGGFLLALGRILMSIGWAIVHVAELIYRLVRGYDWREQYR